LRGYEAPRLIGLDVPAAKNDKLLHPDTSSEASELLTEALRNIARPTSHAAATS
jgi:hypothetical protein